ncbi:phosphotransferase [Streptomyces sp. NPDC090054]|uniref:phosphotransferase n=1 Tax=Streptomyces sp. NPDC090054 TaxID=3365933 RepID=UPI0037FF368A
MWPGRISGSRPPKRSSPWCPGARRAAARAGRGVTACGLPDTLVHGDFHLGNWRSDGTRTVVVDYADSWFGHPATDGLRPRQILDEERWTQIAQVWARARQAHVPGSAHERPLEPVAPHSTSGTRCGTAHAGERPADIADRVCLVVRPLSLVSMRSRNSWTADARPRPPSTDLATSQPAARPGRCATQAAGRPWPAGQSRALEARSSAADGGAVRTGKPPSEP